ncbi:hypothetical protein PanWU01x14_204660 [Parasponia andersonii]|uniref:Uncharacterized protein n=1 Tax=Parasponia andersonii TaxID=3476 RepID=A0A2P5BWC4_PARAD|nr:hypothetical protein PanWU01x14_204660 [Parasponia andersonii]
MNLDLNLVDIGFKDQMPEGVNNTGSKLELWTVEERLRLPSAEQRRSGAVEMRVAVKVDRGAVRSGQI